MRIGRFALILCAGLLVTGGVGGSPGEQDPAAATELLRSISLPPGFRISVFADELPGARSMVRTPSGWIFVGTRTRREVYAVIDRDEDGRVDETHTVATGMNMPNGVAFLDGDLYLAEVGRVLRYDDVETRLPEMPEPVVVNDTLPTNRHHGWKYIAFGPDGLLYLQVGAPCNACERDDERYASIMRMNPDGTGLEVYAHGVRNTVGFAWHPETQELWFTDNGRDMMGDDIPPDELNRVSRPGQHFGFPYFHGEGIPDPALGIGRSSDDYVPPVQPLAPHVAALGMKFYTGSTFPEEYRGGIFIAEHGSWNRSIPIGYRVMFVRLSGNEAVSYEVFADGWLNEDTGRAWGRPVDILQLPDGSLLVSDDRGGSIFRISYEGDGRGIRR